MFLLVIPMLDYDGNFFIHHLLLNVKGNLN